MADLSMLYNIQRLSPVCTGAVCSTTTWTAMTLDCSFLSLGSYGTCCTYNPLDTLKKVFIRDISPQTIAGLACGIAPEYWSFVLLRGVVGMTTSGVFLVSYVLAMEMVGPACRVAAGTLCQFYYTFGFFVMALVAWYLNDDWQMLQVSK